MYYATQDHTLLPEEAKAILRRAACAPIPPDDPLARQKAIDAAVERVQMLFPKFFRRGE